MSTLDSTLATWKAAALVALEAKLTYEAAFAAATLAADGKNAEQRKAQADGQSLGAYGAWTRAEIEAAAAWQVVLYVTASAGRVAA